MRIQRRGKLRPNYIGPFEIVRAVGKVAYELALPPSFLVIHPVFYISILRQYIPDEMHLLWWDSVQLDERLTFVEVLVSILDRDSRRLSSRDIL